MASIEFHTHGDWTAVYLDGVLQRVGDSYLADEWLQAHVGVKVVNDDAFMRGQHQREGVAQNLSEVAAYAAARDDRDRRVQEMREEAKRLNAEADQLAMSKVTS